MPRGIGLVEASNELDGLTSLTARIEGRSGALRILGLRGAARAVIGARLIESVERPVLFLTATAKQGDSLLQDLRTTLGAPAPEEGGRVRPFPRYDTVPYDRFSPQPFVVAQRMDVLYRWLVWQDTREAGESAPVVVAPWTALTHRVPTREAVRSRSVELQVGQFLDRDALVETLVAAGYARMPLVEERGELAVRGSVVDLFPPQRSRPVRIDLLGDEVESLREFDPASQRSERALEGLVAPPAREMLVDRDLVMERDDEIRRKFSEQGLEPRVADELIDALLRGHIPPGAESLAPLLQPGLETVFDFLPDDTLILLDEPDAGHDRLRRFSEEAIDNFDAAHAAGRPVSSPDSLFLGLDALEAEVQTRRPVILERLELSQPGTEEQIEVRSTPQDELRQELLRTRREERALSPLTERLQSWRGQGLRIALFTPALSGAQRLKDLLEDYGVEASVNRSMEPARAWSAPGQVEIRVAELSSGFVLPVEQLAVVTEEEIFGPREKRRKGSGWREGSAIEGLAHLAPGDPLVHTEHGIGIYRGLVMLEFGGADGEFLRLEYAEGDRLFVPVHRLNLVQRYVGADGATPRIDKLGGTTWERIKRGVRRTLRDMARELLAVHATRELAAGHAFSPRDRYFEEFEAGFPFEETEDQAAAIEDVLQDLELPKPMDRLVCGDVGYGKTEVAIRAAFRAVLDGFQVAVLVPTTVLCQQHEETFRERFAEHPVQVEGLSRFRSPAESRRVLEGMESGAVDIVIGTHRLLQKNVAFRRLGLLVVDEEHRFGVAHKERIKELKKSVDVLTLTATPIPRTLQMAFTGLRDLSVIATPPANRLAIRTQVTRFSESLIREAILREVRRGGQVFFVHNRVRTIGAMAELFGRIVPEVRVMVAHGQMKERDLEDRMAAFVRGEADVLLCTTIIESGLDIPRANTILVNRADAMGLAQLYQLRGRVGRSRHRAYAYLLVPGERSLNDEARQRLEAIQDLSELGSGFRLATMDLEIRGAGNLLGAEQSGDLRAVGFDTYMEMLETAVEELRGKERPPMVDPEIRLPVAARLPDSYVSEVSQRLVLYKRLAGALNEDELTRIRDELLDRYGPLPGEARNLLRVIELKIAARRLGILTLEAQHGELVVTASEHSRVDPDLLVRLMTSDGSGIRMAPDQRIRAPLTGRDADGIFATAREVLTRLGGFGRAAGDAG